VVRIDALTLTLLQFQRSDTEEKGTIILHTMDMVKIIEWIMIVSTLGVRAVVLEVRWDVMGRDGTSEWVAIRTASTDM
jgi:hypothetical protein